MMTCFFTYKKDVVHFIRHSFSHSLNSTHFEKKFSAVWEFVHLQLNVMVGLVAVM